MTPTEALPSEDALPKAPAVTAVRFTVAIVCLNAQQHIAEALESVAAQSAEDYELLIVDGGSSDDTLGIIESYADRIPRLRVVSEPDDGLFDAMNKALAYGNGEYIVYLGADDRMAPSALDAVARTIGSTALRPDIVCGGTQVIGEGGGWTEMPQLVIRRGLPKSAPTRHQSIYVRREAAERAGGFNTHFRIAADYDLYLRLKAGGASERLVDVVLSEFRLGGVSSRNAMATAREYRDVRVANGANAIMEWAVMYKSALGATLFAWRRRVAGRAGSGGE